MFAAERRLLLTRCNGALHVYDHGTSTWPRALPKLTDRGVLPGAHSKSACVMSIRALICRLRATRAYAA